jgi:hypothetical protein
MASTTGEKHFRVAGTELRVAYEDFHPAAASGGGKPLTFIALPSLGDTRDECEQV